MELLWTEKLQHTSVLRRIQYPSWLWTDDYEASLQNHQKVLKQAWNRAAQMLHDGRYFELKDMFTSLAKRLDEVAQQAEKLSAHISYQHSLRQECAEAVTRYGEEAMVGVMLPLRENAKGMWSEVYPEGYGPEELVKGTYKEDFRPRKVDSFFDGGKEIGPERQTDNAAKKSFFRVVYVELSLQRNSEDSQASDGRTAYRFSADTTWKAALGSLEAVLDELHSERKGTERLRELISFRRSVLQNVLDLHEIFGAVPEWDELSGQQQEQVSRPKTYKNKLTERKAAVVQILLKQNENSRVSRSEEWKNKTPTDLMKEVENREGLIGNSPGNTVRSYFLSHLSEEDYPRGRGNIEGWFDLAEKWESEMSVWD